MRGYVHKEHFFWIFLGSNFVKKTKAPNKDKVQKTPSSLHPGRLTWNLQITHLESKMIFQASVIMFHVNLPGCMHFNTHFDGLEQSKAAGLEELDEELELGWVQCRVLTQPGFFFVDVFGSRIFFFKGGFFL